MTFYLLGIWGAATGFCAFLLTKLMIYINIEDVPNTRSSHAQTTPKSGGVAVALPFLGAICFYHKIFPLSSPFIMPFLLGSVVVVTMGFWDDLRGLSWRVRLGFQSVVSLLMVGSGLYFKTIDLPYWGNIDLGMLGPIISGLGIIAFMNIYNFMDGLNGLALGSTLIALLFFALIILGINKNGNIGFTLFCICILGATLFPIFLFNFPHGKIFLGDVGSQFLGFILPVLGIMGASEYPTFSFIQGESVEGSGISPFLIPLLFFNFIFDGLMTLVLRAARGKKIWEADRNHLFHILLDKKLSPAAVAYLHFLVFVLQGCVALYFTFFEQSRFFIGGILVILLVHSFYAFWILHPSQKKRHHA